MEKIIIIPARYASTRLPGKPLAMIAGRPMIHHVYERAKEAGLDRVIVATDDKRIVDAVNGFGGEVCLTKETHQSGTERIGEVIELLNLKDEDIIINVQGDEPLIPPSIIRQLADTLVAKPDIPVATLCWPIETAVELFDIAVTKVVMDKEGCALYFSKAPIPWYRDGFSKEPKVMAMRPEAYRHIGIYGQRVSLIKKYLSWDPSPIEKLESLEQLRILWHGEKIHVAIAKEKPGPAVDTPEDLEAVEAMM